MIVDEIHNWKNHPNELVQGFLHTLGLRMDRLLGLSATPFQLGPHELIRVLELRRCIGRVDGTREVPERFRPTISRQTCRAAEGGGRSRSEVVGPKSTSVDLDDLERGLGSIMARTRRLMACHDA